MKKIFLLTSFNLLSLFLLSSHVQAMETIDDVPKHFADLAQKVNQKKLLLDGPMGKHKVLALKDPFTCELCNLLTINTRDTLGNAWDIRNPGPLERCSGFETRCENTIGHCIQLFVRNKKMRPLSELQDAYKKVIEKLKSNWEKSNPETYQKKFFFRNLTDWHVFEKKDMLKQEEGLIHCLLETFKFNQNTQVNYQRDSDALYLFVHKNFWEKFKSVFKLKTEI